MSKLSAAMDELLHGIFTTALEGGIGYWSACSGYHWGDPNPLGGPDMQDDYKGFFADIIELGDDGDYSGPVHVIDRSVLTRGYRLASTTFRDKLAWSTTKPPIVVGPDTDWDFDAGDADMIVQLGLFGEVVYG